MSRVRIVSAAAIALLAVPALVGCGAESSPEVAAMCSTFEEAGGTAATIGLVQIWVPKEDLLPAVSDKLDALGDSTPPAEVADEWNAVKGHYERIRDEAEALPAGGTLMGSDLLQESTTMTDDMEAVAKYISDHC
ncbi:hypothetical protein GCM10022381_13240 [Leifsonia kafniensis]|uniref:Lipoprotein n=1 Tax=Leifsonia kafniensis TaxID=475957 RepID=A0ABP7KAS5_9MICO